VAQPLQEMGRRHSAPSCVWPTGKPWNQRTWNWQPSWWSGIPPLLLRP